MENALLLVLYLLMFALLGLFTVLLVITATVRDLANNFYFRANHLEIDFTNSNLEYDDYESPPGKQIITGSNVVDINRKKNGNAAAITQTLPTSEKEKDDKPFWDDLAALEKERENLENGNSDIAFSDPLDHTRAVHERIAELRELESPPAA